MRIIDWKKIELAKIAAVESPTCDRQFVLAEICRHYPNKTVYFWNQGYRQLNYIKDQKILPTEHSVDSFSEAISIASTLTGVFVIQGMGAIEANTKIACQLENFFFGSDVDASLILIDHLVSIPDNLYSLISKIDFKIPDIAEIEKFLSMRKYEKTNSASFLGLSYGEINLLSSKKKLSNEQILSYKTLKLAAKGLRITPAPDISDIGGLDLLLRDLNKIKKLFTSAAKQRNLRPPKGGLLWGLPGTGKSLAAKMLSKILNVPLISCDWNQLVSSNLSESLQNLELVLQLVDNTGACVLFFDEFEKAFNGWNSNEGSGVMSKLAGKLLSWLQDHTSPSIMIATINRLDMLPPELIRRFEYIWFFDLNLHNGAMYEIFKLHLDLHFPGFWKQIKDDSWYKLFGEYRLCSPAEIAGAIRRVHDEIFNLDLHQELSTEILLNQLIIERRKFKPAISDKSISNALALIKQNADFARPVQGEDRSRFCVPPRKLFEKERSQLPEDYSPAI